MKDPRPESWLARPVQRHLRRQGFDHLVSELQFFEQRIDLYGYSRSLDKSVAVELKLYKWKRAVQQGLLYQLCADLVYVAMPLRSIARVNRSILSQHGLGLISVTDGGRCVVEITAAPSFAVSHRYKGVYSKMLMGAS